jgi:hypothetical protein
MNLARSHQNGSSSPQQRLVLTFVIVTSSPQSMFIRPLSPSPFIILRYRRKTISPSSRDYRPQLHVRRDILLHSLYMTKDCPSPRTSHEDDSHPPSGRQDIPPPGTVNEDLITLANCVSWILFKISKQHRNEILTSLFHPDCTLVRSCIFCGTR